MNSLMLRACAIILLFLAGIMVVRVMEGVFSSHRVSVALAQTAANSSKVESQLKERTARGDQQNGRDNQNNNLEQAVKALKQDVVKGAVEQKAAARPIAALTADINLPIETGHYRRSCSIEQPMMAGPAIDVPLPFNSWSEQETVNISLPTTNAAWQIYRTHESKKRLANWYAQSLKENGWVRYKNFSQQNGYLVYYVKSAADGQPRYLGVSITDQQEYRRFGIILLPSDSRDLLPMKSC